MDNTKLKADLEVRVGILIINLKHSDVISFLRAYFLNKTFLFFIILINKVSNIERVNNEKRLPNDKFMKNLEQCTKLYITFYRS